MSRLPPLTADQKALLREIEGGAGRAYLPDHLTLEKKGLLQIKTGRFGDYTVITEAGRQYLARMASSQVVGLPGAEVSPAPVAKKPVSIRPRERQPGLAASSPARGEGHLLRAAPARTCRKGANQAGSAAKPAPSTSPRPGNTGVSAAKRGTSSRPGGRVGAHPPRR